VPAVATPDVKNGTVYAIGQVGNRIIVGGKFTSVAEHGSSTTLSRVNIFAYDRISGAIDAGFVPAVSAEVDAIVPGPGNTVYIAGKFSTVNGIKQRVSLLDLATGAIVNGWKPPTISAATTSLVVSGGRLFVGGNFIKVGKTAQSGVVALDPTTGAQLTYLKITVAGHHGTGGAVGAVGVTRFDIDPAGTHLVAVGNFTSVSDATGTYSRSQVFRMDLGATTATIDQSWNTLRYTAQCFSWAFDSYIRDVQFDPTGSYFAIVAAGGTGTNDDGTRGLCDTASRWETADSGGNHRGNLSLCEPVCVWPSPDTASLHINYGTNCAGAWKPERCLTRNSCVAGSCEQCLFTPVY
jgi:hypothetical protein